MSQPPTSIWSRFRVRWDFLTKLCGSVPADPAMREAWLANRAPAVRPPNSRSLLEINEEVVATLAEPIEDEAGGLLTFQREAGQCVMRAATIKAHFKDCARFISSNYVGKIQGEKSFAQRVLNGVYLDPACYWIPVLDPRGAIVMQPQGRYDKAVHVMTRLGQRSAIKTIEFILDARMEFSLLVMHDKSGKLVVSTADLGTMMEYGGVHGYGGERGDGEGRYTFTIECLDGKEMR